MKIKKIKLSPKLQKKLKKNQALIMGIGIVLITLVLISARLLLSNKVEPSNIPDVVMQESPVPSLVPTEKTLPPTDIPQSLSSPTPTAPVYKYILRKSNDEIHVHPKSTGYAISATLLDEKWNVVTNQADFKYVWAIDNKDLVTPDFSSFDGCTQGIEKPCPQDHFTFYATQSGQTVIRVKVTKGDEVMAETTFPLIVED